MKSLTIKLLVIFLSMTIGTAKLYAQFQVDPALSAAVAVAGSQEKQALDEIKNEQSKIHTMQVIATNQLREIEKIQRKSYEYLTNVSAGVQNAYDITKSFELTKGIASLCNELKNSVIDNPQGLLTVALATKYITAITTEVSSTYLYITNITLNKSTLLNSAERLQITWKVRQNLQRIYNRLYNLIYQIRALKLSDLPRLLAPNVYYGLVSQKMIAESVARDFFRK